MPRALGSVNRKTKELRQLAEELGVDPLEVLLQMMAEAQKAYDRELAKPPSRRSKSFQEAKAELRQLANDTAPYLYGKKANITTVDETPRLTVIRAPETISDTQEWLAKYAPKRLDAEPQPTPVVAAVKRSLEYAEAAGVDDAQKIVNEAARHVEEEDVFTRLNKAFLKDYE
jgi:hypothetical protein